MVKIQKPLPKKLENKPKLDNAIKQKKQKLKKEKSSTVNKVKLLDDSTPVKEAKASLKPGKEAVEKKQKKKDLNGQAKISKKSLVLEKVSPLEVNEISKKKKDKNGKNVANNVVDEVPQPAEVPKKVNKKAIKEAKVSITNGKENPSKIPDTVDSELSKKSKKDKSAVKEESVGPVTDQQKNKKKQKNKNVPEPIPQIAAAPPASELKKDKKKNNQKNSAIAPEPQTAPSPIAEQKKGKKKKNKQPKAESSASNTTAPVVANEKGKKKKTKKAAVAVPESDATPALEKIKKIQKPKKELQGKKKIKVAFKKQQLADKGKPPKEKKLKTDVSSFRFDPVPYDEEKFHSIVNEKNIKKIAEALKTTVEKEIKTKKSSIFDDYQYFLQVANFKISMCPKRMVKLNLVHPLVDKDDDVLLVVPDLKRGAKADFEATKEHCEDLLRQNGVKGITVMPMNQLRKEYGNFEAKRKLCATYDHFMVDGRIAGHVTAIAGKFTQKPRSTFHSVRLGDKKNIKAEIEKSLRRTAFRQLTKGNLQTIPVGTHKFSSQQLADNILLVIEQLKTVFPGGLGNIRNIHLRIGLVGTSSLPLYISMAQAPEEAPVVIGPREQRMVKLKKEANEVLSKFTLTKEGKLLKLTKAAAEKKRKLQEMAAALTEDQTENGVAAKKAKKDDKENAKGDKKSKKKNGKEVKDLELPENEEDDEEDDDNNSSGDEDDVQLGQGSEDEETEDDEMGTESGAEIVENGFVGEDDESDDDEVNAGENDEDDDDDDDDDEEEDDDDDDDAEDDEESD